MGEMTELSADELGRIFKKAPFINYLGLEPVSLGLGECETRLQVAEHHLQQDGYVHAGVMATMADHTAGAAAATMVRPGELVLSAEFKINMLRPALRGELQCRSTVLKPGARFCVVESEVRSVTPGHEAMVAKALVTIAVVPPPEEP